MKKTKAIHPKNRAPHLPVVDSIVWYLFLDHLKAPGWAWGVIGTFLAAIWIGTIMRLFTVQLVDIFADPLDDLARRVREKIAGGRQ